MSNDRVTSTYEQYMAKSDQEKTAYLNISDKETVKKLFQTTPTDNMAALLTSIYNNKNITPVRKEEINHFFINATLEDFAAKAGITISPNASTFNHEKVQRIEVYNQYKLTKKEDRNTLLSGLDIDQLKNLQEDVEKKINTYKSEDKKLAEKKEFLEPLNEKITEKESRPSIRR